MNNNNKDNTIDVFIVQKCWYAGPHVSPAMDCRRLFTSRHQAEVWAYHSAHNHSSTVRTLSLPDGCWGFVCGGRVLFWVRKMSGAVGTTNNTSQSKFLFGQAHALCTQHILGAVTVCQGGRRPTLEKHTNTTTPRIFVGPHSAHAAKRVLDGSSNSSAAVVWVPIGPPPSLQQLQSEWPDAGQWQQHSTTMNGMDDDDDNHKRSVVSCEAWGDTATTVAIAPPPAKRRCRPTSAATAHLLNHWTTTTTTTEGRMEL